MVGEFYAFETMRENRREKGFSFFSIAVAFANRVTTTPMNLLFRYDFQVLGCTVEIFVERLRRKEKFKKKIVCIYNK